MDRGTPELSGLLARLRLRLTEPADFTRADPETTAANVRHHTAAALLMNVLAITRLDGRSGPVRQEGLAEQIVAAAIQTYQGEDPHPTPFGKEAMLLRGITQGHPFTDANKRTGFLLAIYYLDRIGIVLRRNLSQPQVISICRRVSAGEVRDLGTIAAALRYWTEPRREAT